jgi:hypothetical protein
MKSLMPSKKQNREVANLRKDLDNFSELKRERLK